MERSSPRGAYRELFAVLGATWAVLAAHGAARGEIVVFGTPLVKPDIGLARAAEIEVSPEPEVPSPEPEILANNALPARGGPPGVPAREVPARAEIVAGRQRILLFGDSMVEVLTPRLADYCMENGHELFPAIWYASTTASWAGGEELGTLLREIEPTLVIAALGSSELTMRRVNEREPHVRALVRRVAPRELVWIGPPNWREDTGINALLERVVGHGRFFSSAELALERKRDGIHPNQAGGVKWVDAFVSWSREESAFRFPLEPPTRVAPRIPARVYAPPR